MSDRETRWEFDKKVLFDRTNHCSVVCEDLCHVATVMEEFGNIFGYELMAVTGKKTRIEEINAEVNALVHLVTSCKFDQWSPRNFYLWKETVNLFNRRVTAIENDAKIFLDESFTTLRSAEGAFEMMQHFR